jgi:dethiobiotin synthetase
VRAIADYQLECAGWVANVLDADMPALQENIGALRERIAAPLLGIIPYQSKPDAQAVAVHLNLDLLEKKEVDG